ncbi:hypothetical protein [Rhizobium anhuiense]|uniref:hypothetical protein n=1 Tax=Rhizobium anhuiense TaxID=1184720 RepID=UPI0020CE3D8B|nr:hypothetical protein [Rhizobium anhuiense]UTS88699.1 hypothetical protein NE851_07895 [Rhizobium anhuiense bv. trifolii]
MIHKKSESPVPPDLLQLPNEALDDTSRAACRIVGDLGMRETKRRVRFWGSVHLQFTAFRDA